MISIILSKYKDIELCDINRWLNLHVGDTAILDVANDKELHILYKKLEI